MLTHNAIPRIVIYPFAWIDANPIRFFNLGKICFATANNLGQGFGCILRFNGGATCDAKTS